MMVAVHPGKTLGYLIYSIYIYIYTHKHHKHLILQLPKIRIINASFGDIHSPGQLAATAQLAAARPPVSAKTMPGSKPGDVWLSMI